MKNNNSTTRSFGYKASRDIIMAFVEIAILFLGWLVVKEVFIWIEKNLFNDSIALSTESGCIL